MSQCILNESGIIEELTPEQEAKLDVYVEEGIRIGLDTSEINEERAISAINLLYQCGDIPAPQQIIFCDSPIGCLEELKKHNKSSASENRWDFIYGQHDIGWLSFFNFFRKECELVKETQEILGLLECAKECHWILPYENIVFVSRKPIEIHLNEEGDLHCLTGPALLYKDGFALYEVNGVTVPEDIILHPESITADRIDNEENAEVRRVMVELYGEDKYISSYEPVDSQIFNGREVILYKKQYQDDEPIVKVKVINCSPEPDGTYKVYFLSPLDIETNDAITAIASTFEMTKEEYMKITVET